MRSRLTIIILSLLIAGALVFLFLVNPEESLIAPKCPFKTLTGLNCPGCGGQRAVHAFLHGEFRKGFLFNPILLPALAYLGVIGGSWLLSRRDCDGRAARLYATLTGRTASLAAFIILMAYWVVRDIFGF